MSWDINNNNDDNDLSFHLLRQNSVRSFFEPVKIENQNHENNCFVSVVFHSLFHFIELKDYLIDLQLKIKTPQLIIELQSMMNYYQQINKDKNNEFNENILNPLSFRRELANLFENENQFQLNQQGDPIELLNFLFNILHSFIVSNETKIYISDNECNQNCLIHQLFYINLLEHNICYQCKKNNSVKYDNNYFIHLLNVNVIFENIKKAKCFNDLKGNLILYSKNENQKCKKCNYKIETIYECSSIGKYFILNLGWNGNAKMENLCNLYTLIGKQFELNQLFKKSNNRILYFKGMFLYWSNHYICLFYEKKLKQFVMYDDTLIKKYSSWIELIENLIKGYYQPVALIYGQNENDILDFEISEQFYQKMIKFSIENDKNKQKFAISNVNIKENEWECEWCKKININDNDICINCGRTNSIITLLLEEKFEFLRNLDENKLSKEDKLYIENYINKKQLEQNTQKWVCPVCGCKTNIITNPVCSFCNSKNNDLVMTFENRLNDNQNNKNEIIERKDSKKEKYYDENNYFYRRNSLEDNINDNEKDKVEQREITVNGFEKRKKEEQRLKNEINSYTNKNNEKNNKKNENKENKDSRENNIKNININKSMIILSNTKKENKQLKNIDNNIDYNFNSIDNIDNNNSNINDRKIKNPKNINMNKFEDNNSSNRINNNYLEKNNNKSQKTKNSSDYTDYSKEQFDQLKNDDLRKVEQSINDIGAYYIENEPAILTNHNNINKQKQQNQNFISNKIHDNSNNIYKSQINYNYKDEQKNKNNLYQNELDINKKSELNKKKKIYQSVIYMEPKKEIDKNQNIYQNNLDINKKKEIDKIQNIYQSNLDINKKIELEKRNNKYQSNMDIEKNKESEINKINTKQSLYKLCPKCKNKYLKICDYCKNNKLDNNNKQKKSENVPQWTCQNCKTKNINTLKCSNCGRRK